MSVYGVCAGCGAVAWELLSGVSDYCMGCNSAAYQSDDDDFDGEDEWEDASGVAEPTTKETR